MYSSSGFSLRGVCPFLLRHEHLQSSLEFEIDRTFSQSGISLYEGHPIRTGVWMRTLWVCHIGVG